MAAVGGKTRLLLEPLQWPLIPPPKQKPRDTEITKHRNSIVKAANSIISEVLSHPLTNAVKDVRRDLLAPPKPSTFTALEPFGWDLTEDRDFWLFLPEECTPDVLWPINVGWIMNKDEEAELRLAKFITVTPKEVRGYVHRFGRYMIREDLALVDNSKLLTASAVMVWAGNQWLTADKKRIWDNEIPQEAFRTPELERVHPAVAIGMALRHRYEWAVVLGLEGSPSVRFVTDPTGIKDMFRIRDIPEGRDRRAALLAWITDHWRQNRDDPDLEVYVRKHLRGATSFTFKGMKASIIPSQFDVEKLNRFISEREHMRAVGTDRRQRARA